MQPLDRLSYANVTATIALFIALGGAAWAIDSKRAPSSPALGLPGG